MKYFSLLFLISIKIFYGQVPAYYQSIDLSLSGQSLKQELSNLITSTHQNLIPYTSSFSIDTWDVIKSSDTYLSDTSKVYLVYGYNDNDAAFENDLSREKSLSCHGSACDGLWNREHVFPKSLANPTLTTNFPGPGTDVHNLRSCDYITNSWRGNLKYSSGNGFAGTSSNGNWYPGDSWKGDVARIIMYMYLRYSTQCLPTNAGDGNAQYAPNGDIPDIFLEWNATDLVSSFEENRNDAIAFFQGNRNPFIDNPYLATLIWDGPNAENKWLGASKQETLIDNYQIAPNPSSNIIKIISTEHISEIIIYNAVGFPVLGSLNNKINIEDLSSGIYLISIKNTQGDNLGIKRIVKN